MANKELLLAISDMLDEKLLPLEKKLEGKIQSVKAEVKTLGKEVEEVKAEVKILGKEVEEVKAEVKTLGKEVEEVKTEVKTLGKEMDLVKKKVLDTNLKLENHIEPCLNDIVNCYLGTHKRYQEETDKIEKLELDTQVIYSRVQLHEEILKRNQIA